MAVASVAPRRAATPVRAEFRGNAREYFGIWIVNILLTIVTLGVYSAWAKVRRNRYFYGNTVVDHHSFDYHAKGRQIFIGRVIVVIVLVAVNMVTTVYPLLGLVVPFLFLAVLPFLIVRGLRFSARVTSYRNVRFDFTGTSWGAFKAVILGGIVAFLSLGLLAPLASRWLYRYIFNHLRYGDRPFSTDPRLGRLYRALVLPLLMFVIGAALTIGIGYAVSQGLPAELAGDADDPDAELFFGAIVVMLIPILAIYSVAGIFYRIGVRNVVMNATLLDGRHGLFSDLSRLRYLWIVVSNLLLVLVTFGLMRPWAAVRERRYMVEHSGIAIDGDIGEVMSAIESSGSAVSAEYLDMEGFDFGF